MNSEQYVKDKKSLIFLLLNFSLFVNINIVHAQQGPVLNLNLDDLLHSGLEGNAEIVQAYLEVERAVAEQKAIAGGFYPQIDVSGQYDRNIKRPVFFFPADGALPGADPQPGGNVIEVGFDNAFQASAAANMPIYNKELIESNRLAKTSIKLSQTNLEVNKNELGSRIRKSFFEVLLAQESLRVLELSLANAEQNLANVQRQFEREIVAEYDVIRAEVQVANVLPDIIQAENDLQESLSNLKLLANIPEEINIALEGLLEEMYQQNLIIPNLGNYDLSNNPVLRQLTYQEDIQEHQISLNQAAFMPRLNTFANYAVLSQANDFNFSDYFWVNTSAVGLQLNIPVFQGFTRNRRMDQARIDLKQAQVQKDYTLRSLNLQSQNALNRMERAYKSIEAQEKNILQAERAFQIAQVSYSTGRGTLIEINDAELALTQAKLNTLRVKWEYLNAMTDLQELSGETAINFNPSY
ncbi:TolC family protein [Anditalea andensis]|uniref:Transporter n=1 Tax=Anditalea andensis TaxID=1048983 RepID=A0A074KZ12_9BACT|nr:TolC family protein [Anditalea andensis]KEO74139.1 hypothetical protein EL17_08340 [Anditalea andensis]